MLQPIESPPPSRQPWFAAVITPGPPPVMTENPASASFRPTSRAAAYTGSPSRILAEPNTETAGGAVASASNPSTNSLRIRSDRHVSVWMNEVSGVWRKTVSSVTPVVVRVMTRPRRIRSLSPPAIGMSSLGVHAEDRSAGGIGPKTDGPPVPPAVGRLQQRLRDATARLGVSGIDREPDGVADERERCHLRAFPVRAPALEPVAAAVGRDQDGAVRIADLDPSGAVGPEEHGAGVAVRSQAADVVLATDRARDRRPGGAAVRGLVQGAGLRSRARLSVAQDPAVRRADERRVLAPAGIGVRSARAAHLTPCPPSVRCRHHGRVRS